MYGVANDTFGSTANDRCAIGEYWSMVVLDGQGMYYFFFFLDGGRSHDLFFWGGGRV